MSSDLPRVTFALFTYNQESYVRESVDAALAQDYPNLDIIISDDGSSDRTMEIIRAVASGYRGPHRLQVRQTERNRGTLLHVAEVARLARGAFIVLAAGDDVSKPERTRTMVEAWRETGAWGICSRYDLINEAGTVKQRSVVAPVLQGDGLTCYLDPAEGPVPIVHGCTSGYDMRVFDHLRVGEGDYVLAEDGALTILINLLGKGIAHLDASLVMYRESEGSLTNSRRKRRPTFADLALDERRIERLATAQANRCRLFLRMDGYLGELRTRKLSEQGVRNELLIQDAKAGWWTSSFVWKMAFLARNPGEKWAWARVAGFRTFLLAKWLSRRFSGYLG